LDAVAGISKRNRDIAAASITRLLIAKVVLLEHEEKGCFELTLLIIFLICDGISVRQKQNLTG
jgi:hypothetical protein